MHVTLAVLNQKELKSRLKGRSKLVPERRSKRYLKNFDAIWSLQSYLLSEADRTGTPIIVTQHHDQALQEVMRTVMARLASEFTASPDEVFAPA